MEDRGPAAILQSYIAALSPHIAFSTIEANGNVPNVPLSKILSSKQNFAENCGAHCREAYGFIWDVHERTERLSFRDRKSSNFLSWNHKWLVCIINFEWISLNQSQWTWDFFSSRENGNWRHRGYWKRKRFVEFPFKCVFQSIIEWALRANICIFSETNFNWIFFHFPSGKNERWRFW